MTVSAIGSTSHQITVQQVTPATVKRADGDGDGRTGVAALNDGDQAAQQAALQVRGSTNTVNVTA